MLSIKLKYLSGKFQKLWLVAGMSSVSLIVTLILMTGCVSRPTLNSAVKQNNYEQALLLLLEGQSPNKADYGEEKPLIVAVKNGSLNLTRLLLEHGADINISDSKELTPLAWATKMSNMPMVSLLLTNNPKIDRENSSAESILMLAVTKGNLDIIEALVQKGADVNFITSNAQSALYRAVEENKMDLAKFLLEQGAKINNGGYFISFLTTLENNIVTSQELYISTVTPITAVLKKNEAATHDLMTLGAKSALFFKNNLQSDFVLPLITLSDRYVNTVSVKEKGRSLLIKRLTGYCTRTEFIKHADFFRKAGVSDEIVNFFME